MILGSGAPSPEDDGGEGGYGTRILTLLTVVVLAWKVWQFDLSSMQAFQRYLHPGIPVLTILVIALFLPILSLFWNWNVRKIIYPRSITAHGNNTMYLGRDKCGQSVHIKHSTRTVHAQVIGTTMAGKTESVVLPWAVYDIELGASVIIIDGKGDKELLERFYSHVVKAGRQDDFKLVSLGLPEASHTFNPLLGGAPHVVAERLFSALSFDSGYYKAVQFQILNGVLDLMATSKTPFTFADIVEALSFPENLRRKLEEIGHQPALMPLLNYLGKEDDRWHEQVSGLVSQLSPFTLGPIASLLNQPESEVCIQSLITNPGILYCQLPTMHSPIVAPAIGRMILQNLQQAISTRHQTSGEGGKNHFVSIILDDFQDFIYEEFGSILNKSRSANVGVVFSHQSLGDLDKVGEAFRNIVTTNTNIKVIMRTNDPDTCEHFARTFGTKTGTKVTDRRKRGILGDTLTGDGSLREVEEYRVHPNAIKQLSLGQGVVTIPHGKGVEVRTIQLQALPKIPIVPLPMRSISEPTAPPNKSTKSQRPSQETKKRLVG